MGLVDRVARGTIGHRKPAVPGQDIVQFMIARLETSQHEACAHRILHSPHACFRLRTDLSPRKELIGCPSFFDIRFIGRQQSHLDLFIVEHVTTGP